MNTASLVTFIASLWHVAPVRWFVYSALVLWVGYIYVMRLKRIKADEGLSILQKVVGYPVALFVVVWDWLFNWTFGTLIYRELPHAWKELLTQRLQRALDNPDRYGGYRLTLARWLKPELNRHDPGHLE